MCYFNNVPYKYLVTILLKLKNIFCLSFPWPFTQTEHENAPKKYLQTKHLMFREKSLRQPRKFYTTVGCDG